MRMVLKSGGIIDIRQVNEEHIEIDLVQAKEHLNLSEAESVCASLARLIVKMKGRN